MKKFLQSLIFLFVIGSYLPSFSQLVPLEKAQKVALNFYLERYNLTDNNISKSIFNNTDFELQKTVKSLSEQNLYYVFNVRKMGYIIVSACENIYPVLGYSFDNKFTFPITCPTVKDWMQHYDVEIEYAINNNLQPTSKVKEAWQEYLLPRTNTQKDTKAVTPLVLTTWDQGNMYNTMCPVDAAGDGGHVWAGCVATSMAQVMKYYNYPVNGSGSNGYTSSPYGYQSADFSNTTYRWNDMTLSISQSNSAIAELIYHCGVSVNMVYGASGSSASTIDAATALISNFKYNSSASYKNKYLYTTNSWNNLIVGNLDIGRPVIYSGSTSAGAGHAWVCDGYQGTNSFHMNWGWSGYYNGYFLLDALDVNGDSFNFMQGAVVNIYPGQSYPYYCTGTKTLTAVAGTFDDGSGPSNYQNNNDCYWLIDPTITVAKIKISFDDFSTESGNDVVTVYDGETTGSPVLGTFSGSAIPSQVTSSGGKVLVHFTSNSSGTAAGWHASYSSTYPVYCTNLTTLTALSDVFSDGSGANNYNPVTTCRWRIMPPGATSITLSFTDFDVTDINDVVEIYDVSSGNVLVNSYTGTTIPATQTYDVSKIMVWFKANSQTPGTGWTASYTCTVSGMENITDFENLYIYPNPAKDFISVGFKNINANKMILKLYSSTGQKVYESNKDVQLGINAALIPVNSFSEGIYFLNITTEKSIVNYKVVIQH